MPAQPDPRATPACPLLKDNAKLRKAAVGHSNDMVADGYFDHTSLNGDTFVDRILDAGYAKRNDGWTIGENLAWGTGELSTPQAIMNAWMNSAGHKANILKKAYKEVGIAVRLGVAEPTRASAPPSRPTSARRSKRHESYHRRRWPTSSPFSHSTTTWRRSAGSSPSPPRPMT